MYKIKRVCGWKGVNFGCDLLMKICLKITKYTNDVFIFQQVI